MIAIQSSGPSCSPWQRFAAHDFGLHARTDCGGSGSFWGSPMVLFPRAANQSSTVAAAPERRLSGYVMTDSNIRTAVDAWLSNSAAAEATYGHISTWDTSGVTDMARLFCAHIWDSSEYGYCNAAAASFNEDISAWDTSRVTTMWDTFSFASAFNQDIGGWTVHRVTDMRWMFNEAYAFDQDLGWCVDDGVDLYRAFYSTQCESTSCGVEQRSDCPITGYVMDDSNIYTARDAWLANAAAAEATYGHISTWETGGVTDMSRLFCAASWDSSCNTAAASFNEDISAWDTSSVTSMHWMFHSSAFNQDIGDWVVNSVTSLEAMFCRASAFNQDIGDWTVHSVKKMDYTFASTSSFNQDIGGWACDSVTRMSQMFNSASAFDQDLGWCVDYGVDFDPYDYGYTWEDAFSGTRCASTSCGVVRDTLDSNGNCQQQRKEKSSISDNLLAAIVASAAAVLLLAVAALCFYRRSKGSETKPSGGVDSPPKPLEPLKAQPEEEATAIAVAPEAEEALSEQLPPPPATGWFAAKPEGEPMAPEHESASFAPEASSLPPGHVSGAEAAMMAAREPPPQPGSWFGRAAPEPEPEFEPEPEC